MFELKSSDSDERGINASRFTWEQLRTLRSGRSGHSPLRVIALIDLDAFYAQVEQVRLGIDRDVPFAVRQWESLVAVNYAARARGVLRFQNLTEAKSKCPELQLCHVPTWAESEISPKYRESSDHSVHKVSLEPYRKQSQLIQEVYKRYCDCVERASIDESYFDLSSKAKDILLRRYFSKMDICSDLQGDKPEYTGTNKEAVREKTSACLKLGSHMTNTDGYLPNCIDFGITKIRKIVSEPSDLDDNICQDWDEVLVTIGGEIIEEIRGAIFKDFKYTCSAGISVNKTVAKLASGFKKPNNQTVVFRTEIKAFMSRFKIQDIRSLGGNLGAEVVARCHTEEVSKLLALPKNTLPSLFGPMEGNRIRDLISGIDNTEIMESHEVKSMLAAKNFRPPIKDLLSVTKWLKIFAADLYSRLSYIDFAKLPHTIALHYRIGGKSRNRQQKLPYNFNCTVESITKIAFNIFENIFKKSDLYDFEWLGLSLHDFSEAIGSRQLDSYFSKFQACKEVDGAYALDHDNITLKAEILPNEADIDENKTVDVHSVVNNSRECILGATIKNGLETRINRSHDSMNSARAKRRNYSSAKTKTSKMKQQDINQTRLYLGSSTTTCSLCGMTYKRAVKEDEVIHRKYHEYKMKGLQFTNINAENILWQSDDKSDIVVKIDFSSSAFPELKSVLSDHSSVFFSSNLIDSKYQFFVFFRNRRCAGLLVVEKVKSAKIFDFAINKYNENFDDSRKFILGVRKALIQEEYSGSGITTLLLELARFNFIFGSRIDREEIAFFMPESEAEKKWMLQWIAGLYGSNKLPIYE